MEKKKFKLDKEFLLSSWAIDNKMTVWVIIGIILFAGTSAFLNLPREDFPEIIENKVYVSTIYPGNGVEDVEKLVTIPIEDEIRDISGIIDVQSSSMNDYSMITIEFEDDISIESAKLKVKDKMDALKAKTDWPTLDGGAKVDPSVFEINMGEMMPILIINLKGNYNVQQLKKFGEIIEQKVELIDNIKDVSIRGVEDKEVEIALDAYKMAAAKVSFDDVIQKLSYENTTITGGNLVENEKRKGIRIVGEVENYKDLSQIVIKNEGGAVYLGDIADVQFTEKESTTFAREKGENVVMLEVVKRSGSNMIAAIEAIKEVTEEIKSSQLPEDVALTYTNDMSGTTQNKVDDLINNIIFGVLLVVGVLMFFLGFNNAAFVGYAIPLSMLMSLIIVQLLGYTLNTMVLFALVMGLGMLVDNGIVVVENVYSLMSKGIPPKEAAKQGVGEIAWPIIASTATTLAAFFPLGFWPGVMGKFMMYFPLTLSFVLGSSLFVALVINSMLTSRYMIIGERVFNLKKMRRNTIIILTVGILSVIAGYVLNIYQLRSLGNLGIISIAFIWLYYYFLYPMSKKFQKNIIPKFEYNYQRFLSFALRGKNPVIMIFGTFGLLVLSFILIGIVQPKVLFFPESDPNQIIVYIEYPEGTEIEKTNELTKVVEQKVIKTLEKYVVDDNYNYMAEAIVSQVGEGAQNAMNDMGSQAAQPNKGKVTVSLRQFKFRKGVSSKTVKQEVKDAVGEYSGATIIVDQDPVGPPSGYPINLEIRGVDYNQMMDEAEKMVSFINSKNIDKIDLLKIDVSRLNPELQLKVDRSIAGELGVSSAMVGATLRKSLFGWEATTYKPKNDKDDYPVNVRLKKEQRRDKNVLFNQLVTFRNQGTGRLSQIPISSLISEEEQNTFTKIKRNNFERTITIYSTIEEGANANELVAKIESKLKGYHLPAGMYYKFTGEQEEQAKQMNFLLTALLIGVVGIILIIVMQFNSISKPIIIMTGVVLSFAGVFLGLIIFKNDFVILMTMMGIISLAGIVVNNAIVLIDYTELLFGRRRKELGVDSEYMLPIDEMRELVVEAGKSRLQPVLLTAITTIFGLIPLAIGFNIDFFGLLSDYNPNIYLGGDNTFFWGPLAKAVIYGLVFATFMTLVIVPVLFFKVSSMKRNRQER